MQVSEEQPHNVVSFQQASAYQYIQQAIAMFAIDPPDSEYQRGYLDTLLVIQNEAFDPRARLPQPPRHKEG